MNSMLQRHCARYIYVVPDGLRELMSDISREVLRSQPPNMYIFIADYLDALIVTRENARVAARLVQSLTEMATTTATFLEETGMSRDEIDNITKAIQKTFRRSIDIDRPGEPISEEKEEANIVSDVLQEIEIKKDQAELAATIIQQSYRRFKERREREKELLAGMVDWRIAARSAIQLYRKSGVTNEEANRAATLIKAAYKGYYTRRFMKKLTTTDPSESLESESPPSEKEPVTEQDFKEEEIDDMQKSVKINYETVKPHVDFDTGSSAKFQQEQHRASRKSSTSSSIVRHSLKYLIDTAVTKIGKRSAIIDEEEEISSKGPVLMDLAEQTMPVNGSETKLPVGNGVEEPMIIKEETDDKLTEDGHPETDVGTGADEHV